jgi:hypothetical protein
LNPSSLSSRWISFRSWLTLPQGLLLLWFLAIAAGSAFLLWCYTPWGVEANHDSIFYMISAENIAHGKGVYWVGSGGVLEPLVHFPPIYPFTLAIPTLVGLQVDLSARLIAAILFGLNVSLFGFSIYAFTRQFMVGIVGSAIVFISPVILERHITAMSEPLFFLLSFASMAILAIHLAQPKPVWLILSAILASMAYLTRYTGLALLATGVLSIFAFGMKGWKRKFQDVLIFSGISALMIGTWLIRNIVLTGSATNRTLSFHPIDLETLRDFFDYIAAWFIPREPSTRLVAVMFVVVLILLCTFAYLRIRRSRGSGRSAPMFVLILVTYLVLYLLTLFISFSFFDASTRLDDRILSPIFIAGVLAILLTLGYLLSGKLQILVPIGLVALWFFGPLASMWQQSKESLSSMRDEGGGFTSKAWRSSDLIKWIDSTDDQATIYTNQALVVYFLTKRPAYQLPERWDPVKAVVRSDYPAQLAKIREKLKAADTFLVMFKQRDLSLPPETEVSAGLALLFSCEDGEVFIDPVHLGSD